MPFSTDDPNAQALLARNASFDAPQAAPQTISRDNLSLPAGFPAQASPIPPPDTQQPGGIRKFFANVLAGMADAAMKESTGMNFAERHLAQLDAQQKQQEIQFAPIEAQAKLSQLSQQPRFNPTNGQPLGLMNDTQYQQYLHGLGAAQTSGSYRVQTQQLANQGKMNVAQLQSAIAANKGAKYILDLDPQTGQKFYHVMNPFDQEIGRLDVNVLPQLMTRTTNTVEFKEDDQGNILALPKSTTSGPNLPGPNSPAQQQPATTPQQQLRNSLSGASPNGTTNTPQMAQRPPAAPRVVAQGKSSADNGTAYNPATDQVVEATRAEAASGGLQNFTKAAAGDFTKWRSAQMQFNDVQSNLSRYKVAAQRFAKDGQPSDGPLIDTIINKSGIFDLQLKIGEGGQVDIPGVTALLEAASRESRSSAYAGLSAAGKDLVDGYFRTMAALPAYQRAITQSGRSSDHQLNLEIPQIANPTMAPSDITRKLNAFQENVRQGVQGIPQIKGMPTLDDVIQKFEGSRQSAPVNLSPSMFMQMPAVLNRGGR